MIYIGPGKFLMGDRFQYKYTPPDWRPSTVTISCGYWIGQYEITQREYRIIMNNNPSEIKNDSFPVTNVSWKDALRFCRILTETEKRRCRIPDGYAYRLPTDAEWEYACRAGTATRYFFGDNPCDLNDFAWIAENSGWEIKEVGLKKQNPLGLYDMLGNAEELCLDSYGDIGPGSFIDPLKTPNEADCISTRGGSSVSSSDSLSCGYVDGCGMNRSDDPYVGFRIVLAKVPKAIRTSLVLTRTGAHSKDVGFTMGRTRNGKADGGTPD